MRRSNGPVDSTGNHIDQWRVYQFLRSGFVLHDDQVIPIPIVEFEAINCKGCFLVIKVTKDDYTDMPFTNGGTVAHVLLDVLNENKMTYLARTVVPSTPTRQIWRRLSETIGNVMFFRAEDPWLPPAEPEDAFVRSRVAPLGITDYLQIKHAKAFDGSDPPVGVGTVDVQIVSIPAPDGAPRRFVFKYVAPVRMRSVETQAGGIKIENTSQARPSLESLLAPATLEDPFIEPVMMQYE